MPFPIGNFVVGLEAHPRTVPMGPEDGFLLGISLILLLVILYGAWKAASE